MSDPGDDPKGPAEHDGPPGEPSPTSREVTHPQIQERKVGPIGGDMATVVAGLAHRARLPVLVQHHSSTAVLGLFAFVNGVISIGLMAFAGWATGAPFIFPSLGPTAFLLFYTPTQPVACPRNTICGHAIGAVAGYVALVTFGLQNAGPALSVGVTPGRMGAAALSLGLTSGMMVWLRVPHPPAGATTLIVSLGILTQLWQLGVLMLAVVLLVGQGLVINRLAGVDYPWWSPRRAQGER